MGIEIARLLGDGNGSDGWVSPSTERQDSRCRIDYFLIVSATQTADHASAARMIRVNS